MTPSLQRMIAAMEAIRHAEPWWYTEREKGRWFVEDLIDFPVSDVWRDHYAAQGLTYPSGRRESHPGGAAPTAASEIRELKAIIQTLRDQLAEIQLTQAHPHLKETNSNTPPKPAKTFEE